MLDVQNVKSISELIQLSIAPVFTLAAVAGFLAVFTGRMARIIDRLEKINKYIAKNQHSKDDEVVVRRKTTLIKRMKNTNLAILFMCLTGLFIALVMISMFLSFSFGFNDSMLVSALFVSAMSSLIVALLLFLKEIFYTVSSADKITELLS